MVVVVARKKRAADSEYHAKHESGADFQIPTVHRLGRLQ
jgi:hypothetical protein